MDWYFNTDGEKINGPIREEDLVKALISKEINKDALVWNETFDDWEKVENVLSFQKYLSKFPPPLPSQRIIKSALESKFETIEQESITLSSSGSSILDKESFKRLPKDFICTLCGGNIELEEKERIEKRFICPHCLRLIDRDSSTSENERTQFTPENKAGNHSTISKDSNEITTKWLDFYVNGWLPVGIILNLLALGGDLNDEGIIFQSIGILFLVLTFFGLRNRKIWGWYINWINIFWLPIGTSLIFIGQTTFLAYLLGGLLIFTLPNAIYFNKRKFLFDNK